VLKTAILSSHPDQGIGDLLARFNDGRVSEEQFYVEMIGRGFKIWEIEEFVSDRDATEA
jgi:hypothetical protein